MKPPIFTLQAVDAPPPVEILPVERLDGGGLEDGVVDVWLLDRVFLEQHRRVLADCLSPDECARRDRLVRVEFQERFLLFRGALRQVLAGYLEQPASSLRFDQSPAGKPYLSPPFAAAGLEFNVSHSGGRVALACARGRRVGVDIESVDERTDVASIAERFFHPEEVAALGRCGCEAERRSLFFAWWAAKESYLKAHGAGITDGLERLDFSAWKDAVCAGVSGEDGARWLAWRFGEAGRFAGSLMAEGPVGRIRFRRALQENPPQPRRG